MKVVPLPDPLGLGEKLGLPRLEIPKLSWKPQDVQELIETSGATGVNATEFLLTGGLRHDAASSPFEVVVAQECFRLRRYFPGELPDSELPALLLVPPLMMMADLFDVAPKSSSVAAIHAEGVDVWVVDFGRPEVEPGGLERTIADHVLAVSHAIDQVRAATGRDVVLGGYSQGGMFAYQAAAYRRGDGIDSLITFGSPVDFAAAPLPLPLSFEAFTQIGQMLLDTGLVEKVALPGWFNRTATKLLDPLKGLQFQLHYLQQLGDREKLVPGEQQRQFLEKGGWTAYSGPAVADLLRHVMITNRLLAGGLVIGDRAVSLADLELPILTVIGEIDKEGHPASVRAIRQAAPRAELYELSIRSGHFGIVAGAGAVKRTWPQVASWVRWRSGEQALPEVIVPADEAKPLSGWAPSALQRQIQGVIDLGVGTVHQSYSTATGLVGAMDSLVRERAHALPLINRIEALRPDTAASLGLLLDEGARRDPKGAALLYGDRVISNQDMKLRVDSVVKGLISAGLRAGDRVGVLMDSRPSAFSVLAAISRLGAVSVLLRPDGDLAEEAHMGLVTQLVCDPGHVDDALVVRRSLPRMPVLVLGAPAEPRELPDGFVDLEQINPGRVTVPSWYRPNATTAADLAFVMFAGSRGRTRVRHITNQRWMISALGTASAAQLTNRHTVYSATPLHHSSALMTAVGGAVASGARLALASGEDRNTFWEETRRYGATHVSYTWSSLRQIARGSIHQNEQGHSIRMFMGSGMEHALWREVIDRFNPARVLEFYASAEGEATLANVTGAKVGSAGRPLPGTAAVKLVRVDSSTGRPSYAEDGFARETRVGEVGLLLVRSKPTDPVDLILRGVFERNDSWRSTGDLFTRDAEGDFWFVDPADALIITDSGTVAPSDITRALNTVPAVDLALAFGAVDGDENCVPAAVVSLRPRSKLTGWELQNALQRLDPAHRPRSIQVVRQLPCSTWSRPMLPVDLPGAIPTAGRGVWLLDPQTNQYRQARPAAKGTASKQAKPT